MRRATRLLPAAVAAVALAAGDWLIVGAAFMDRPRVGEALLACVAGAAAAAWLLHRPALLFAAQNLLLVATTAQAVRAGSPPDGRAAATVATSFLIANGLCWLVARAIPRRRTAD